jgi:hypothetical protein
MLIGRCSAHAVSLLQEGGGGPLVGDPTMHRLQEIKRPCHSTTAKCHVLNQYLTLNKIPRVTVR